ncbi:MAG: Na+/H+ antiporter NhaA, partial [Dehalococcoidia bacterium]
MAVASRRRPITRLLFPFREFARIEASAGILLVLATVTALVWVNSGWSHSYEELWATSVTLGLEDVSFSKPLHLWINDGLMAVFFFVVSLEIKREILTGQLSTFRTAVLPGAAALGGMLVPALLYSLINAGEPTADGWGIPMATDIAFTLGALALLGTRAPAPLKVFVTALAIADDLGAILVVALFFTDSLSAVGLAAA